MTESPKHFVSDEIERWLNYHFSAGALCFPLAAEAYQKSNKTTAQVLPPGKNWCNYILIQYALLIYAVHANKRNNDKPQK
jgi:hypothetical protein